MADMTEMREREVEWRKEEMVMAEMGEFCGWL